MSTSTFAKRSYAQAHADAVEFRAMFPLDCYERWEIAGSLRRGKSEVGDVEHVVIPRVVEQPMGLFGASEPKNLLWHHLDALVDGRRLAKHLYVSHLADGSERIGPRWGDTYRGVDFNGFNHEIFCATQDNYGAILAIRTGPAEFSQMLVTRMKQGGMYRQQDGAVVHVASGERVSVPDEETFFKLAGMRYVRPEDRR
jgi:DNA polymerase/3'-5' exonuclease PolX